MTERERLKAEEEHIGRESRTHRIALMAAAYELIYLSEWQYHDESTPERAGPDYRGPRVYLSRGSMDA